MSKELNRVGEYESKGFFDANWYRDTYFIKGSNEFLLNHYDNIGWKLGYNPSALFDSHWYVNKYKDLEAIDYNPLLHFIFYGFREGRNPSPWIEMPWYLAHFEHEPQNPLCYYLNTDTTDLVNPHPLIDLEHIINQTQRSDIVGKSVLSEYISNRLGPNINPCILFNVGFIRSKSGIINSTSYEMLRAYIEGGLSSRIVTHPLFDGDWYYNQYRHVQIFNGPMLMHYLIYGAKELLSPHLLFDPIWLRKYSNQPVTLKCDLEKYLMSNEYISTPHPLFNDKYYVDNLDEFIDEPPLVHYVTAKAMRAKTHPLFDGNWYLNKNPDCISHTNTPLVHYLTFGWKELRNPNGVFQERYYQEKLKSEQQSLPGLVGYVYGNWRNRLCAHPLFDEYFYINKKSIYPSPLYTPLGEYFVNEGDRFDTHLNFASSWYKDTYMRGVHAEITPLEHFSEFGFEQRLDPSPAINMDFCVKKFDGLAEIAFIDKIIDKYSDVNEHEDTRMTFCGRGVLNFIQARLGLKSQGSYPYQEYEIIPVTGLISKGSIKIDNIRESTSAKSARPVIFDKPDSSHDDANIYFPNVYIAYLHNVMCRGNSRMLLCDGKKEIGHDEMYYNICPDSSSKLYGINTYGNKIYMDQPLCSLYIEKGIHLLNEHDNNYFHWVVEMLPRIIIMPKELFKDYPVLISENLHRNMHSLLDIVIGVDYKKIVVPKDKWVFVGDLIYPSDITSIPDVYDRPSRPEDVSINAPELRMVRDVILKKFPNIQEPIEKNKVCYFPRKTGIRRIVNESDIINYLQSQIDINIISTQELSIREQIEIFANIEVAIIPTGASMTNILWCKPGTKVICLFSDHSSLNPYLWQQLGEISKVELVFIIGERTYDVTDKHSVHDNYKIDSCILLEAIRS